MRSQRDSTAGRADLTEQAGTKRRISGTGGRRTSSSVCDGSALALLVFSVVVNGLALIPAIRDLAAPAKQE